MSQNISAWFTEKIRDQVIISYQSHGGMLDNTMMRGDVVANTVKFPIAGRSEVYELTGAIEAVPVAGPGLSTVSMPFRDYEASDWWRVQDAYKAGPNEQAALSTLLVNAVRRKKDNIKLDALATFAAAGGDVATIGDGTVRIDVLHLEQARAQMAGAAIDDEVYCVLPALWMSQLCFYKEFADAQWVGLDGAPFSKTQRMKTRTVRSTHYIEMPDEHFTGKDGTSLYAYMWAKNAMGAETAWDAENPSITQHAELQGSPYLIKTGLGASAIGIQGKGVKRLDFLKITALARPA